MSLPRSSYYYKPQEKKPDDFSLRKRIEELAEEFNRYGYRRITAQLHREGVRVNHKKVLRLMRERDLLCKPRHRWVRTTDSDHRYRIYPNLLPCNPVTAPNQVWVADITYIRLPTAFVYLAVVLDLFSRKAVGYGLSLHIDSHLSLQALHRALQSRNPPPGVIHHSDRGVQYAADDYVQTLVRTGFQISMARKGNPYDNAVAESFIKTLKNEEIYLWEYRTLDDVKNRVPYFIEQVYNQKRLHSALNYRPPEEFEKMFLTPNPCLTTLT
jgi:transposase InsO family protein